MDGATNNQGEQCDISQLMEALEDDGEWEYVSQMNLQQLVQDLEDDGDWEYHSQENNHHDEAVELMIALQEDGDWSSQAQVMKQNLKMLHLIMINITV
jgi:hypothetical protein